MTWADARTGEVKPVVLVWIEETGEEKRRNEPEKQVDEDNKGDENLIGVDFWSLVGGKLGEDEIEPTLDWENKNN